MAGSKLERNQPRRAKRDRRLVRIGKRENLFQLVKATGAVRNLRSRLLSLVYDLAEDQNLHGYLVLVEPQITESRLHAEWNAAARVIRHDLAERLNIAVIRDELITAIPRPFASNLENAIAKFAAGSNVVGQPGRRPDYFFVVLKILMRQWLLAKGPSSPSWLMKAAGCSYPTVAGVIKRLGKAVTRHSNRTFELNRLPQGAWAELLAVSDRVRLTSRFIDQSGKPRSAAELLRRLQRAKRPALAVGGAAGARHWCPSLDLHGDPRLDLSIHCGDQVPDLGFVDSLDPALAPVDDPHAPATVVIHAIRRRSSFFEVAPKNSQWADPVECLLDLHEMRLVPQAMELLDSFKQLRRKNENALA